MACTKHLNPVIYTASILCALTLLSSAVLASDIVSADVIDDVTITVPAACTFADITDTGHTATIRNGQLANDIGTTTFTTYCNDTSGFAIYAIGYSGDTYGNTNMLPTNTDNPSIATGLATSGSTSAWAMKLAPVANAYTPTIENGYDSYKAVPSTYTKVASFNAINDASIGSVVQTTYRVYVSGTQPADTYTGKVRYTLVHPASEVPAQPQTTASGKICYYANVSDAVGTMGCQNVSSSVTLLASNFSRNGYGFAGWSDAFDYTSNSNANFYGPNETITLNTADYSSPNDGLSLYAVWVESVGSLQDTNKVTSLCGTGAGSLTIAPTDGTANLTSVSALTDLRDNQTYAIAKLADGKCWMIENLRLENTNSDNGTGALAQGYGGQFAGLADAEPAWNNNSTDANSLYSTDGSNNTINIGTSSAGYRVPRYNNVNTPANASDRPQNPTTNSATNSDSKAGMYSYGNYYSWHAAIADTTAYTSGDHSSTSICPKGWHLPIGGRKSNVEISDFWKLSRATIGADPANFANSYFYYTGTPEGADALNKMKAYPLNFVYSGYIYGGSISTRGSVGRYWSSTAYSSADAYSLGLNSTSLNVWPGTYDGAKSNGRSVRCVASSD